MVDPLEFTVHYHSNLFETLKVMAAETVPVPLLVDAYLSASTVETCFYLRSLPFIVALAG